MYTYIRVYMYVYVCTCTCMYVYIYIYTYIYAHIYVPLSARRADGVVRAKVPCKVPCKVLPRLPNACKALGRPCKVLQGTLQDLAFRTLYGRFP